jgi:hypothetical protein
MSHRTAKRQRFYARRSWIRRLHRIDPCEVLFDRGDGNGFTRVPLKPGEWPRAMIRSRRATAEEQAMIFAAFVSGPVVLRERLNPRKWRTG